jgi:dipeptidyl aminopeptidase/acylaminoacyl peptidase
VGTGVGVAGLLGRPAEFIALKNEDHWLSHGTTRLQMLEASMAFLKTNNPAD